MVASAFPVVVVGASAGGVEALKALMGGLPRDLAAPVVVVLHLADGSPSVLPQILQRAGRLIGRSAEDGDVLQPGHVYVAAPGRHLELDGDTVRLSAAPPQDHHRPSVDRLFTTAAETLGPRVVGVVLSGALRDGSAGLATIHEHGGRTVVQEPETAAYRDMPSHALAAVPTARSLPLEQIAGELVRLCGTLG